MEAKDILIKLLYLELVTNATRLKFIYRNSKETIDEDLLTDAISILNELSVKTDELSKKQLIAICACFGLTENKNGAGLKIIWFCFFPEQVLVPHL